MDQAEHHWTKIFSSSDAMKVGIAKGILHDREIPVIEMNKQDTVYLVFGTIDLMVPSVYAEVASLLVSDLKDGGPPVD